MSTIAPIREGFYLNDTANYDIAYLRLVPSSQRPDIDELVDSLHDATERCDDFTVELRSPVSPGLRPSKQNQKKKKTQFKIQSKVCVCVSIIILENAIFEVDGDDIRDGDRSIGVGFRRERVEAVESSAKPDCLGLVQRNLCSSHHSL